MTDKIFDVVMPQMGESITQATIIKWNKQPGDAVASGETLLEISTDKVSAELPAAIAGTLVEVLFPANATVDVDTVIARIAPVGAKAEVKAGAGAPAAADPKAQAASTSGAAAAAASKAGAGAGSGAAPVSAKSTSSSPSTATTSSAAGPPPAPKPARGARPTAALLGLAGRRGANGAGNGAPAASPEVEAQRAALLRRRSTPLVRNIANDLGVDLARIPGSGLHGRVTKKDIVAFVEGGGATGAPAGTAAATSPAPPARPAPPPMPRVTFAPGADEALEPLSPMRRLIAEHMVASVHTSPHAYTVHEIDLTRLEKLRERARPRFEAEHDTRLTPLAFISLAVVEALGRFPTLNASLRGHDVVYHRRVNLGIAVALDAGQGLIVPVIRGADGMNLLGMARAIGDIATRARTKKLSPEDVKDGTFTLTSPGQLGALMGTPIINQPQAAILHIGAIAKRPAVVEGPEGEDLLTVRTRCYMTLGIDHRLIDGWIADSFMSAVRDRLERADFPDLKA